VVLDEESSHTLNVITHKRFNSYLW